MSNNSLKQALYYKQLVNVDKVKRLIKNALLSACIISSQSFVIAETMTSDDGVYEVSEMCGTTKVRLQCDQPNKNCERVDMFFQVEGQPEKKIDFPKEIKKEEGYF